MCWRRTRSCTAWRRPSGRPAAVFILDVLEKHIYNPEKRRQAGVLRRDTTPFIDLHSYGHDIETSWLADPHPGVLGDDALTARIRPLLLAMAEETLDKAFTDHGFAAECERGRVDTTRVWWVQAEALLGFLNAWEKTGEDKFLEAARSQWRYIRNVMADSRPGSEVVLERAGGRHAIDKRLVEPESAPITMDACL